MSIERSIKILEKAISIGKFEEKEIKFVFSTLVAIRDQKLSDRQEKIVSMFQKDNSPPELWIERLKELEVYDV